MIDDAEALHRIAALAPADPELVRWLRAHQLALAQQRWSTITFNWHGGRSFDLDGQPLVAAGRGLAIGWLVLTAHQARLPGVAPAALYPTSSRPDANALEALGRAALGVAEPLAACIRAIGTSGGLLSVKRRLPCKLVCSSPVLVAAAAVHDKATTSL